MADVGSGPWAFFSESGKKSDEIYFCDPSLEMLEKALFFKIKKYKREGD